MEETGCDYCITDLVLYNEEGKEIDRRIRSYVSDTSASALKVYHLKYHMTGTDTMMLKKEYLTRIGGFALINVGDEFYLMLRAIEGGGKFGYLPGCALDAYVHTGEGGLSRGDGTRSGDNYEYNNTFFVQLRPCDVRYITMRHYAVLAYTEIRRKRYGRGLTNAMCSFMASPVQFFVMLKR